MMDVRPIKSEDDLRAALQEIDQLWQSRENTLEGDRLEVLLTLVEAYESRVWPMPKLDPVEAIIGHMDMTGRSQADLGTLFGSRSRASEILARKRPLTLDMIRKLDQHWGLPASQLIAPYKLNAA